MTPKITIITPSFNQGHFLEQTINSILNENYSNLEYIVIDGGSTDNSIDIIKKYEKQLSYWTSEKDNGQADAINKGFKRATGEIITWINSDDLLAKGTLHRIAELFSNSSPTVGLIHGNTFVFDSKKYKKPDCGYNNPTLERYISGMAFPQPSSFIKKKYWDEVGLLNTDYHYGMDYDLFSRLALVCEFKKVDELFSYYRLHEHSKSVAENNSFIKDWAGIYANLLFNLNQEKYVSEIKKLKILDENYEFRKFHFPFSAPTIKTDLSFYYFLSYVVSSDYRNNNFGRAKGILNYVKMNYNELLLADSETTKIAKRLKLFPEIIITGIRNLKK